MIIQIFRQYKPLVTLGELVVIDGKRRLFFCKTVERPWLSNKKGQSCFPATGYEYYDANDNLEIQAPDHYDLKYEYSPRFKRFLWEVYGTPNRAECKFHVANYAYQLEGCVAPGDMHVDINRDGVLDIRNSRKTLDRLHSVLPTGHVHKLVVSHISYPVDLRNKR